MRNRGSWLTAAVLAIVVLLAQIAGAATREETVVSAQASNASVAAQLTGEAPTVTLPELASAVAQEKTAAGTATANESVTTRGRTTTTDNTAPTNAITMRGPAGAPTDSTSGARPGWGCGDTNHTHSGPPGRPLATPPPGCTKP